VTANNRRCVCVLSVVIALAATGVLDAAQAPAPDPITDAESYRVYGAIVSSGQLYPALQGSLVIAEETIKDGCGVGAGGPNPDWLPVWENFDRENARARRLTANQPLGRPYQLATRAELEAIHQHFVLRLLDMVSSWWRGGMLAVSAVGFDATKTRARVSMWHYQCASGCGSTGQEWFFVKRDGLWQEAGEREVGASSPVCMVAL